MLPKKIMAVFTVLMTLSVSHFVSASAVIDKKVQPFSFDVESFKGQKILWPTPISSSIKSVTLKFSLPSNYHILEDAKPTATFFTKDNQLVQKETITSSVNTFTINKQLLSAPLYVSLNLFYCKEGDRGLCLVKNVLFEIPIESDNASPSDLTLDYQVPEVN